MRLEHLTAMPTQTVQTVKALTTVFANLDLQEMGDPVQVSTLEIEKPLGRGHGLTFHSLTK